MHGKRFLLNKWGQVLFFACIWIMLDYGLILNCDYISESKKQDLTPQLKNLTSVKFYTIENNRPNK